MPKLAPRAPDNAEQPLLQPVRLRRATPDDRPQMSPARELQTVIAQSAVEQALYPPPVVRKWPSSVRAAFILGSSAALWGMIIGAARLALS